MLDRQLLKLIHLMGAADGQLLAEYFDLGPLNQLIRAGWVVRDRHDGLYRVTVEGRQELDRSAPPGPTAGPPDHAGGRTAAGRPGE